MLDEILEPGGCACNFTGFKLYSLKVGCNLSGIFQLMSGECDTLVDVESYEEGY